MLITTYNVHIKGSDVDNPVAVLFRRDNRELFTFWRCSNTIPSELIHIKIIMDGAVDKMDLKIK